MNWIIKLLGKIDPTDVLNQQTADEILRALGDLL